MRLIDRLHEYLKHHRISAYTFERTCGIANGYLKKQIRGKGTMGSEILEKISDRYRDLSLIWLLTGQGQMLHEEPYPDPQTVQDEAEAYAAQQDLIRLLRDKIAILENALNDKEKIIRLLEAQLEKK